MFEFREENEKLVLVHRPYREMTIRMVASLALFSLFAVSLFERRFDWASLVILFLFGIGAGFGFFGFLQTPTTVVEIDRRGREVSVRRRSRLESDFKIYSFDDLAGRAFIEAFGSAAAGEANFRLVLPLKKGGRIQIGEDFRHQRNRYDRAAEAINLQLLENPTVKRDGHVFLDID